jgi:NADPH:quinone reductase
VPEAFTTAHDALFTQAGLTVGERVLVSGAAGGVGMAAVQLATMAGARVSATVRDPAAREQIGALGINALEPEGFEAHGPFDVIFELVGGPNMPGNLEALAECGRICVLGVGAGAKVELNLWRLMRRRGRIHGSLLRPRSLEEKADAARRVERAVLPGFASGDLSVPVSATFPLDAVADAYARFQAGGKLGKIVLEV